MYKQKINNMGDERLPKIALKSSQTHLHLKRSWCKYVSVWLSHWGVDKNDTLQNINNIKNIITSKFKEKMWCKKDLEDKRKLRYYKEVINPNLEDQKYLKKKVHIAKIRMNSHELHSEIGHWKTPKTLWVERICHIFETMSVEDESHFLLKCLAYTYIRFKFHNICYNIDLPNFLTCQNYSDVGKLLFKIFKHISNTLKKIE